VFIFVVYFWFTAEKNQIIDMEFKKVKPRRRSEEAELSDLQKKPELR